MNKGHVSCYTSVQYVMIMQIAHLTWWDVCFVTLYNLFELLKAINVEATRVFRILKITLQIMFQLWTSCSCGLFSLHSEHTSFNSGSYWNTLKHVHTLELPTVTEVLDLWPLNSCNCIVIWEMWLTHWHCCSFSKSLKMQSSTLQQPLLVIMSVK